MLVAVTIKATQLKTSTIVLMILMATSAGTVVGMYVENMMRAPMCLDDGSQLSHLSECQG